MNFHVCKYGTIENDQPNSNIYNLKFYCILILTVVYFILLQIFFLCINFLFYFILIHFQLFIQECFIFFKH